MGERATLASGAELWIRLELLEPGSAYLIYHDAHDEVDVIVAHAAAEADAPRGFEPLGAGSRLDRRPGLERFHLIVAAQALETLDDHVRAHRAALPEARAGTAQALLTEVQRIRGIHETMESPAARPAPIGGTVRGTDRPAAVEISGKGVFCRTFTIDHR